MKRLRHGSSALLILCQRLTHDLFQSWDCQHKRPEFKWGWANEELNAHHFVNSKQALDIMNCKQINKAKVTSTAAVNKQTKQQKYSTTRGKGCQIQTTTNNRPQIYSQRFLVLLPFYKFISIFVFIIIICICCWLEPIHSDFICFYLL